MFYNEYDVNNVIVQFLLFVVLIGYVGYQIKLYNLDFEQPFFEFIVFFVLMAILGIWSLD